MKTDDELRQMWIEAGGKISASGLAAMPAYQLLPFLRSLLEPASPINWQPEDIEPTEKGWYTVKRADGSLCLRAWGNGEWWIPLKDGWFSGLPAGFQWFGPVEPIEWDTPRKTEQPKLATRYDWSKIPLGYNWAATDGDGEMTAFTFPPVLSDGHWREQYMTNWRGLGTIFGEHHDWRDSLEARPK